jgi:hypothetical protein
MKLPPIPPVPHLPLPHQLVIPVEVLTSLFAAANIIIGFLYLLFGLKVFRVMTTVTAVIWGAALGVMFGYLIDSVVVAIIFCAAGLGVATWFYTRWMIALPFGLGAAALAWTTARLNGANPLASFFIALATVIGVGGPVLLFYRTVVMGLTCVQGAVLVIFGTAATLRLLRHEPLSLLRSDFDSGGHIVLAGVCVLLLAIPAFYYQRLRYGGTSDDGDGLDDADSADEYSPRKKAA